MEKTLMKKASKYAAWLEPFQEPAPLKSAGRSLPPLNEGLLKKHFTQTQVEFLKRRVELDCPDLRYLEKEELPKYFARDRGINDAGIIMTFIVQYFVRFLEKQEGSIRGNLKSFWYRKLARNLERLGRLEVGGGLRVTRSGSRSRYLLKTMEDSFEQLFRRDFFHYRDLDVYNHREKFFLRGRNFKRHLLYTEKEGLFWFCEEMYAQNSCHAYASRGSATWLDIDYLAKSIGDLAVRNLYVAAFTDYDPWGVFIAKQIQKKLESHLFGFRSVRLEIMTTLDLFDDDVIEREKRYLLTGHEDPKDTIHQVVKRWVNNGGGIDGQPYGIHVDFANWERAQHRVQQWLKGKFESRLSRLDIPEKLMNQALRSMRHAD